MDKENKREQDADNVLVSKAAVLDLLNSVSKIKTFHKEQTIVLTTLEKQLKNVISAKKQTLSIKPIK